MLLGRVQPGAGYVTGVLPGILVFGLGLAMLVAPLTAAVLGAVSEDQSTTRHSSGLLSSSARSSRRMG
jgi:hypothetical protein